MDDFGQTYFRLLNTTKMYVDNQEVKPVDPCFATPGMLGYEDPSMNNLKSCRMTRLSRNDIRNKR